MNMREDWIPTDLMRVLISECDGDHQIVLKETKGKRQLPIAIGPFEALAIHAAINQQAPLRPMTHDLMANIVEELEGNLDLVVIDDYVIHEDGTSGTFHAKLVFETPKGEKLVDCRPSDAIALAARLEVPLAVANRVFESQSVV